MWAIGKITSTIVNKHGANEKENQIDKKKWEKKMTKKQKHYLNFKQKHARKKMYANLVPYSYRLQCVFN